MSGQTELERLAALLELTTDFVSSATAEGQITYLNRNGARLVGLPPEASTAHMTISDFHPPWATELILSEGLPVARSEGIWSAETALLHRDGYEIPVSQVIVAHRDPESGAVEHVSTIIRDIRGRKQTEQELRERTQMLRLVLDNIPQHVFWKDRASVYRGGNLNFAKIAGFDSIDEVVGKTDHELALLEEKAAFYREQDERIMASGQAVYHWVEETHVEGAGAVWLDTHKIPLLDDRGEVIGLLGMIEDITARRLAEDQLRQVQKLESMGQLAGGVAHDFNNMLTAIRGATELLAYQVAGQPDLEGLAQIVLEAAENAAGLTQRLLEFSRKGSHSREPVDLHAVIDGSLTLLRRTIDKRVDFQTRLAAKVPTLLGDPSQLQNLLLNLALNAQDAMPQGGTLTIETAQVELLERDPRVGAFRVQPGPFIAMSIRDTGTGMSPDVAARAFEPFFTTKDVGAGTGLGLSAVYSAVVAHGGAVVLESEVGEGTTFVIFLPVDPELQLGTPARARPDGHGRGRVLLIDDEVLVRRTGAAMLKALGYEVVQAADGTAGVEAFVADPHSFDVVLLDLVMPKMSGRETLTALRAIDPEVRVLFCSGFTRERVEVEAEGVSGFLKKPYRMAELARQIADAIDT